MEYSDSCQDQITALHGTSALVLAGPGCGKTHILARRIFNAHAVHAVPFESMLCITFTNRAAREMTSRIEAFLGYRPEGLFVGNIHRFCLKFLFDNELVPPDTGILDEEDQLDYFLSDLRLARAADIKDFTAKAAFVYQHQNNHPDSIIRRPNDLPSGMDMFRIRQYTEFKENNHLIDFDDILLRTYTALMDDTARNRYKNCRYSWIQVDEVQDMTPLQLAIIDRVSAAPQERTSLFLGDEQQAIFSFLGAGGRALDIIKNLCAGNIRHLQRNYRSPQYLVEMCNCLAINWLHANADLLPKAVIPEYLSRPMIAYTAYGSKLAVMASATARRWLYENPEENVMILVRTNAEGEEVSATLNMLGMTHFHISKQDVFHQPTFKTIWSHLAALALPRQWNSWQRLIYSLGATHTLKKSRAIVDAMRSAAIEPEALLHPGTETAIERLVRLAADAQTTIAVIDTETTGLDIFNDDIIQIAAVKYRRGEIVEGSQLVIFIDTQRQLPYELGHGVLNPMVDEYAAAEKLSPDKAFEILEQYLDGCVVAAHNADFDANILRQNITRRTQRTIPEALTGNSEIIDTLALAQLLLPRLRNHKLSTLIEHLHIRGVNSHNAVDDVAATASLISALLPLAQEKVKDIRALRADDEFRAVSHRITQRYFDFYYKCRAALSEPSGSLAQAVEEAYEFFAPRAACGPIEHFDYVLKLIDRNIVDYDSEPNLRSQLAAHLYDLPTYHESDLFAKGIVRERLSVMTIHKAKGLEADNVILYDACSRFGSTEDNARVLYVAFSRAQCRLAMGMSGRPGSVLDSVIQHFNVMHPQEVTATIGREMTHFTGEEL